MFDRTNMARYFFSQNEKEALFEAIHKAELKTSGEIRVHVTNQKPDDLFAFAVNLFETMGMTATEKRNGVLIVLAAKTHQFTILGDEGINNVVPKNFWHDVVELATKHFKQNHFADGLCLAVGKIGDKLIEHFPFEAGDTDELSNEITYS